MTADFPSDLEQFINRHIHSVAQLEVILLLRRESGRSFTADDVARSLYIGPQMASALLSDLARDGFVVPSPEASAYSYHAPNTDIEGLIGALESAYHERRVAVTSMIYSKPSTPAQAFADAFRLRKES